ncbi:MAG: hypothetical protein KGZ30_03050 [Anaplasmataceae bacterium]|nr:hypothetical protein [Anaplasmataceae bacterium]
MINYARRQSNTKGQAALATVFLIGGVIVLFALTLAFLALRITATTFSAESSSKALAAATAGAEDAVIKVIRNPGYQEEYSFAVNANTTTTVSVVKDGLTNQTIVIASSTVGSSKRSVQVVIGVSSSTGRVDVISWETVR